jgi:hypothetical protein
LKPAIISIGVVAQLLPKTCHLTDGTIFAPCALKDRVISTQGINIQGFPLQYLSGSAQYGVLTEILPWE